MEVNEMYEIILSIGKTEFPKKCTVCNQVFHNIDEFLANTDSIGYEDRDLLQAENYEKNPLVDTMRNCKCGSTLMTIFEDRRDVSPEGRLIRFVYDKISEKVSAKKIPKEIALSEIAGVLEGRESKLFSENDIMPDKLLMVFLEFMCKYFPWSFKHDLRVSTGVTVLANEIGVTDRLEIKNVQEAALLHGLGKILTPIKIVNKPDKLTPQEYEIMKKHCEEGYRVLCACPQVNDEVRKGVLYHHERYDGAGYPEGLSGKEIPEVARILAVADSFDAIISPRPYKEANDRKSAINILKKGKGTQFDPDIIDALECCYWDLPGKED